VISVLIADDQDLVREGLRMLLEAEPDLCVAGEAGNGSQALAQARRLDPDVVLMDVRMPEMDGIEATTQLVRSGCRARILMLTTFNLDEYVYRAMKAGASGFLLKDASREQLAGAVRTVAAGQALLAPAITRRLIEDFCRGPAPGARAAARPGASASGNSRSCGWLPRACRTPRSRPSSTSATPPSKATLPASSPSWACATGYRSRCSPTKRASSGQAAAPEPVSIAAACQLPAMSACHGHGRVPGQIPARPVMAGRPPRPSRLLAEAHEQGGLQPESVGNKRIDRRRQDRATDMDAITGPAPSSSCVQNGGTARVCPPERRPPSAIGVGLESADASPAANAREPHAVVNGARGLALQRDLTLLALVTRRNRLTPRRPCHRPAWAG
jgi:DNA-binding NarL/FixJ family response regulator